MKNLKRMNCFLKIINYKECPNGKGIMKWHDFEYKYEYRNYSKWGTNVARNLGLFPWYKVNERDECINCGEKIFHTKQED